MRRAGELTFGIWRRLNCTTKRKIILHVCVKMIKPRPYFSAVAKIQSNVSDLRSLVTETCCGKTDSHPGTCLKRTLQVL